MANGESSTARRPEDLAQLFEERVNTGDVEGLVALYEPEAVLHFPPGNVCTGVDAIRQLYQQMLAGTPSIKLEPRAVLLAGDLALTSTRWTMTGPGPDGQPSTMNGTTAEVARRQPDGTWRWVIDEPNISG